MGNQGQLLVGSRLEERSSAEQSRGVAFMGSALAESAVAEWLPLLDADDILFPLLLAGQAHLSGGPPALPCRL